MKLAILTLFASVLSFTLRGQIIHLADLMQMNKSGEEKSKGFLRLKHFTLCDQEKVNEECYRTRYCLNGKHGFNDFLEFIYCMQKSITYTFYDHSTFQMLQNELKTVGFEIAKVLPEKDGCTEVHYNLHDRYRIRLFLCKKGNHNSYHFDFLEF